MQRACLLNSYAHQEDDPQTRGATASELAVDQFFDRHHVYAHSPVPLHARLRLHQAAAPVSSAANSNAPVDVDTRLFTRTRAA